MFTKKREKLVYTTKTQDPIPSDVNSKTLAVDAEKYQNEKETRKYKGGTVGRRGNTAFFIYEPINVLASGKEVMKSGNIHHFKDKTFKPK